MAWQNFQAASASTSGGHQNPKLISKKLKLLGLSKMLLKSIVLAIIGVTVSFLFALLTRQKARQLEDLQKEETEEAQR